MKTKFTIILSALGLFLFSNCSRKPIALNADKEYKELSRQLEMSYQSHHDNSLNDVTASIDDTEIKIEENASVENTDLNAVRASDARTINAMKRMEKLANNKLVNKIITRKVEKAMKKMEAKEGKAVSGNLRTGIIVGAVGLLLLIIAGFFGGAAGLIYVLGAVLFVIGVVLILLSVL